MKKKKPYFDKTNWLKFFFNKKLFIRPSTKYTTPDPEFCNKTVKFNEKAIEGLLPQLNKYWPNMFPDTDPNQLW